MANVRPVPLLKEMPCTEYTGLLQTDMRNCSETMQKSTGAGELYPIDITYTTNSAASSGTFLCPSCLAGSGGRTCTVYGR